MKKLIVLLVLLMTSPWVWAVTAAELYSVDLPVSTQSSEERAEVAKQGFYQLLKRLSGDPDVEKNPVIKVALNRPDYYVDEFNYSNSRTAVGESEEAAAKDISLASSQYFIHLRFNKTDVDRLLQKAGVSLWTGTRPLILVWLAYGVQGQPMQIVGNESGNFNIISLMRAKAEHFGLPLIFPVMDVADMSIISVPDIRNMSQSILKEASKRYHPDAILIGTVREDSRGVRSQWQLVKNDERWGWSFNDKSTENVFNAAMKEVLQALVKTDTSKNTPPGQWFNLEVVNVKEDVDLGQLTRYLKQNAAIQQIQLTQVSGELVELSIQLNNSLANFQQTALAGKHLLFKPESSANDKLVFEWVR